MIFYRADHSTLFIKLNSDEPLGILDSEYIEDYNGIDGQLSIYNVMSTDRTAIVMTALPAETPGVNNDVFEGQILLSTLPDGDYQVQGRVRDLIGNYTILSNYGSPNGNERVMPFEFTIADGAFIPFAGRTTLLMKSTRRHALEQIQRASLIPNHERTMSM